MSELICKAEDDTEQDTSRLVPAVFSLPVHALKAAEESWAARPADESKIAQLKESMKIMINVNMQLIGVCFVEEEAKGRTLVDSVNPKALIDRGIYLLSGNHRRLALLQLQAEEPDDPRFQLVNVSLIMVCNNKANHVRLRHLGMWNNTTDHLNICVSFLDKMTAVRKDFLSVRDLTDPVQYEEIVKKFKQTYKVVFAADKKAEVVAYIIWAICSSSDAVWTYCLMYLDGTIHERQKKVLQPKKSAVVKQRKTALGVPINVARWTPTSWASLQFMVQLPETTQLEFLKGLFDCTITLSRAKEWLFLRKYELLARRYVCEDPRVVDGEVGPLTIEDVKKKWRGLLNIERKSALNRAVANAKIKMPKPGGKLPAPPKEVKAIIGQYFASLAQGEKEVEVRRCV